MNLIICSKLFGNIFQLQKLHFLGSNRLVQKPEVFLLDLIVLNEVFWSLDGWGKAALVIAGLRLLSEKENKEDWINVCKLHWLHMVSICNCYCLPVCKPIECVSLSVQSKVFVITKYYSFPQLTVDSQGTDRNFPVPRHFCSLNVSSIL